MELFRNTNFDFLGKKWPFIIASLLLTAAGFVSLAMKGGPRYGIDFKGGTLVYVKFAERPPIENLRTALGTQFPGSTPEVQEVTGSNEVIIGTDVKGELELQDAREKIVRTLSATFGQQGGGKLDINNAGQQAIVDRLRDPLARAGASLSDQQLQDTAVAIKNFRDTPPRSGLIRSFDELAGLPGVNSQTIAALKQEAYTAPYSIRQVETVGPKIGDELRQQAIYVVLSALGGMLVYIALRFEWIYGVAAVIAVFHDTVITVGLFSLFDKELTLTVVAALLTLVGYSMNDTIVVFDRIRENLKLNKRMDLQELINMSVNQTLSRTILTSGLTLLTCLSLWLFGGPVLNGFSFALVVGIIVGTYSTIFIAGPVLIYWQNFREKRSQRSGSGTSGTATIRKATVATKVAK